MWRVSTASVIGVLALASCAPGEGGMGRPPAQMDATGAALFADYCAACHGADGRGNGSAAAGLSPAPADLTQIAARNGGTFPEARVMSTIDGYRQGGNGRAMPEFGAALADEPMVLWEDQDGAMIPTPEALVALAAYLESIQQ